MVETLLPGAILAAGVWLAAVLSWTGVAHARFRSFHRRRGLSYPPLGVRGWARFYARTVVSLARVWWWWLRSAFGGSPEVGTAPESSGEPVLCIHGFFLGESSLWGLRRSLERRGRRTAGVFLGWPYRSPDAYARSLRRRLEELLDAPGARLDAVAHSMGGLVLRQVLAEAPELAGRVGRVVTLGSPHHGTGLLRRLRFGPVYRMMALGAPYLEELATFRESAPQAVVTTVASRHDLVVYPVESAHLEGAERITLEALGHLGLLTERDVHEVVAERLAPPSA